MVGMDEVDDGRGVDIVDHGNRQIAEPDIFAGRGADRIRLGDNMIVQIVDEMRLAGRGCIGDDAFGQPPQGVISIGAFRRAPGGG